MLKRHQQRAFSLIELMVVVIIVSLLMAVAVPAFSGWLTNTRIRNVTTDFYAGLQQARAEAIARNSQVRFQSVDTMTSSCALSVSGAGWVINRTPGGEDAAGSCNVAPDPTGTTTTPFIIAKRAPDADTRVTVTASASSVVFNALGKVNPATAVTYDFKASSNGGCAADGGDLTCLRVTVSTTGQLRMCNPRFPAGDPQACS